MCLGTVSHISPLRFSTISHSWIGAGRNCAYCFVRMYESRWIQQRITGIDGIPETSLLMIAEKFSKCAKCRITPPLERGCCEKIFEGPVVLVRDIFPHGAAIKKTSLCAIFFLSFFPSFIPSFLFFLVSLPLLLFFYLR